MENNFSITDNFLTEQDFGTIRDSIIGGKNFNDGIEWKFNPHVVHPKEDPTPGQFVHTVYFGNVPCSPFYNSLVPIIEHKFSISALYRIKMNLTPRFPESYTHKFHSDLEHDFEEDVASHWTTAILYINTNNGYTEFENGEKVESVANRVVMFPSNFKHRGITQTDEQTRILINFNFLKRKIHDGWN